MFAIWSQRPGWGEFTGRPAGLEFNTETSLNKYKVFRKPLRDVFVRGEEEGFTKLPESPVRSRVLGFLGRMMPFPSFTGACKAQQSFLLFRINNHFVLT